MVFRGTRGCVHEVVSQNLLGSLLKGSARERHPQRSSRSHNSLWSYLKGFQGSCPWGGTILWKLLPKFQNSGTKRCNGKISTGRSDARVTCWDTDLKMLWETAWRDRTCSAKAHGEEQVRPGSEALTYSSILPEHSTDNIHTMLVHKGEIFSTALFLHSRQRKVDLELKGNILINDTLLSLIC